VATVLTNMPREIGVSATLALGLGADRPSAVIDGSA
jgi:hypothetical protein